MPEKVVPLENRLAILILIFGLRAKGLEINSSLARANHSMGLFVGSGTLVPAAMRINVIFGTYVGIVRRREKSVKPIRQARMIQVRHRGKTISVGSTGCDSWSSSSGLSWESSDFIEVHKVIR